MRPAQARAKSVTAAAVATIAHPDSSWLECHRGVETERLERREAAVKEMVNHAVGTHWCAPHFHRLNTGRGTTQAGQAMVLVAACFHMQL